METEGVYDIAGGSKVMYGKETVNRALLIDDSWRSLFR